MSVCNWWVKLEKIRSDERSVAFFTNDVALMVDDHAADNRRFDASVDLHARVRSPLGSRVHLFRPENPSFLWIKDDDIGVAPNRQGAFPGIELKDL